MDADFTIAEHYESIINRVNSVGVVSLSEADRVIWYIVSARCERDMGGFESIFLQLVSEGELVFLIDSLRLIDEPESALQFDRAYQALKQAGFYDEGSATFCKFDADLRRTLAEIDGALGDQLWKLDAKLARLIGSR